MPTAGTAADRPLFGAYGLTKETADSMRLDGVSFEVAAGTFMAILGAAGSGKSTLVKAIVGRDPATAGTVIVDGVDAYRHHAVVQRRLGYVPQDDILHGTLTVSQTLEFAAELRLADHEPEERRRRCEAIVDNLGLRHRANARADSLSGGQRKRVNVAVELLAEPDVLLLDEPTSGLDPGTELEVMTLLRQLANGPRAVIVVTHNVAHIDLCDRVLFLADGGRPVYLGPPNAVSTWFNVGSLTEAYQVAKDVEHAEQLHSRFRLAHPPGPAPRCGPAPTAADTATRAGAAALECERAGHDAWVYVRRNLAVMRADRRALRIQLAQGPAIALLMLVVFGGDKLRTGSFAAASGSASVLLAMVLSVVFVGTAGTIREIVRERPIFDREQAFGASAAGYLASKLLVGGVLAAAHSAIIVAAALARQSLDTRGLLPTDAGIEIFWTVALTGMAAVALGLMISALVDTTERAMTVLPVVLFVQLLLAGAIFPIRAPVIEQLSWGLASRWGFDASAASTNLWELRGCKSAGGAPPPPSTCSAAWQHEVSNWMLPMVMLTLLTISFAVISVRSLRRTDPVRVLAVHARR